jgi:hypothetical protein
MAPSMLGSPGVYLVEVPPRVVVVLTVGPTSRRSVTMRKSPHPYWGRETLADGIAVAAGDSIHLALFDKVWLRILGRFHARVLVFIE